MKTNQFDIGSESQRWNRGQSQPPSGSVNLQDSIQQKENYPQVGYQIQKQSSFIQTQVPQVPPQPNFTQQQHLMQQQPLSYRVGTEQSKSPMRESSGLSRSQSGQNYPPGQDSYFLTGWGSSKNGQLSATKLVNNAIQAFGSRVTSASVGENHTMIIDYRQELYACGSNAFGQLGIEGVSYLTKPTPIPAFQDVKISFVSCGANHTFAISTQGEVFAWGFNMKGQLGIGNFENQYTPTLIYSLLPSGTNNKKSKKKNAEGDNDQSSSKRFKNSLDMKSQGEDSSLCLQERANSIENMMEQLNKIRQNSDKQRPSTRSSASGGSQNFGINEQNTQLLLGSDEFVSNISCGALHTIVVTSKNRLFSVGFGESFALGHGDKQTLNEFKLIKPLDFSSRQEKIEKLSCGLSHSVCVSNGKAFIWGTQGKSESLIFQSPTEMNFSQGQNSQIPCYPIIDAQAGDLFTIFLNNKGEIYGLGENDESSLCSDSIQPFEYPKKIQNVPIANQISVGHNYCLVISKDMRYIYGWGSNFYGQVTGRITNNKVLPSAVKVMQLSSDLKEIKLICGSNHTIMLSNKALNGSEFTMREDEQQPIQNKDQRVDGNQTYNIEIEKVKKQSQADNDRYLRLIDEKQNEIDALKKGNVNLIKTQEKTAKEIKEFKQREQDLQKQIRDAKLKGEQAALALAEANQAVQQPQQNDQQKFQIKGVEKFKNVNFRVFNSTLDINFNEIILEAKISEGGYGIIHRAKWRETVVAVKKFKMVNDENSVRDFLSECHAMEALRHPNIVMFLGACTKAPDFSIILEFCQNGSLWSYLQSGQKLTWDDRKRLALDTARGVHYLHSSSPPILHRDLKSLNILLDDNFRCKLADFGWTRVISQDNYMTTKIGTYQWMAPEVISSNYYTEKADVFSFGIILWEIASREPPYRNKSGTAVSIEVVQNNLRPTIPKTCPPNFADLMQRCWETDPNMRPSFKEIIKELEKMNFSKSQQ